MKKIICALLSACMLLCLAACDGDNEPAAEVTEPTTQTENKEPMNEQIPEITEPPVETEALEDPSLAIFRQSMVETPRLFAVAFFGYAAQDADPFAVIQEAAPQLCEDLPFLLTIREENIVGSFGYLFCIVPAVEAATVAVNRRLWNPQNECYEEPEVLYRSESGDPILVLCPNENGIPDTEITVTDPSGTVAVWNPCLDPGYRVSALLNDKAESLLFDFTPYEELLHGIDISQLAGSWELAWTEVDGDRNEAAPGVCTVQITPDGTDAFRFTYASKDFPEENVQDRALNIVPGELYPGCSNDRWIAEVAEESGDAVQYALTLLEDGTLLLQTYWEMDGMPWVSYGWYKKLG